MEKQKSKKDAKDELKLKDQVLKLLDEDNNKTPEERLQLLLRKYVGQEKQFEGVLREKENLQREYNKSVLMRDKLQEVCREQQKIIKSVKNESMLKIREEEERRKESQAKFQASLNEITQSLGKNNDENLKLRDHNIEMTKKLKFLAEQYRTREQQLEKLNEQVQLESQLHQAKLNKAQVESAMEKEILLKEKQIVVEKLLQTQKVLKELTERELALKEQLHLYTSKYDDFQLSLQKSNDIFATYKTELDKMSKNTKKLERESLDWKRKWEKSNATLIQLATEKKERDDYTLRSQKQVEQLQKLLRALQHERTHMYQVMREQGVECPAMPPLPPEPEAMPPAPNMNANSAAASNDQANREKMEQMSRNCAELKATLANLQSQMKLLNLPGNSNGNNNSHSSNSNNNNNNSQSSKTAAQQQHQQEKKRQKRKQKQAKHQQNKTAEEESAAAEATATALADADLETLDGAANGVNDGEAIAAQENGTAALEADKDTPASKEASPAAAQEETKVEAEADAAASNARHDEVPTATKEEAPAVALNETATDGPSAAPPPAAEAPEEATSKEEKPKPPATDEVVVEAAAELASDLPTAPSTAN